MENRNYPTTSQEFRVIRKSGALYIDKTKFILPLLGREANSNFFLSRPRRFGKSLFLSALEAYFLGEKELFKGLYIYDKVLFETHPVIRLSMDKIGYHSLGLYEALLEEVQDIARKHKIELLKKSAASCFRELIEKLYEQYGKQVVLLIDEYDKPIIQYLEKEKIEIAETNRDVLKEFFGVLKSAGNYLRLVFITGVSKFSKVSIFSDLNYFNDLTLDKEFVEVCGFTELEIRENCVAGLGDLAKQEGVSEEQIMDKIRYWYDGFSWNGKNFVYNPFSTMYLFEKLEFKNYWFETATPTMLAKRVNVENRYGFRDLEVKDVVYEAFDLRNIPYITLMLQTGYLTFKKPLGNDYYKVDYPNKEVESAFTEFLLAGYFNEHTALTSITMLDIQRALERHDIHSMMSIMENLFKTLPAEFFQEPREKKTKEGFKQLVYRNVGETFYHAIIYLIFKILGVQMKVEVSAQEGRIDAVVETEGYLYLFEFKKDRSPKAALNQIKKNEYEKLYALSKKQVFLIGVGFSAKAKGLSNYDTDPKIPK